MRRGQGLTAITAGTAVIAVGTTLLLTGAPATIPAAQSQGAAVAVLDRTPPSERAVGSRAGAAPSTLRIPALGVDAPVDAIAADRDGTLRPPDDPTRLGWWSGGEGIGAAHGTALVTGHTVHTGGGALDDLGTLTPGAHIGVLVRSATGAHTLTFSVVSVRDLSHERLALDAPRLFGKAGPPRLAIVTCTDFDGTDYRANTVVLARPDVTRPRAGRPLASAGARPGRARRA